MRKLFRLPIMFILHKNSRGDKQENLLQREMKKQKEYVREKLSDKERGKIYGKRKIDVELVFAI